MQSCGYRDRVALVYSRAKTPRANAFDCLLVKAVAKALLNPHIPRDSILPDGHRQLDRPLDTGCKCFGGAFWLSRRRSAAERKHRRPRGTRLLKRTWPYSYSRHALAWTLIADERRRYQKLSLRKSPTASLELQATAARTRVVSPERMARRIGFILAIVPSELTKPVVHCLLNFSRSKFSVTRRRNKQFVQHENKEPNRETSDSKPVVDNGNRN